jgi:hypothetical protein
MTDETGTLESVLEDRRARSSEPDSADLMDDATDAPEAVETVEPDDEPLDDADAADGPENEAGEPVSAIDAPHYWPADKKAEFARLPADLQALVSEQEAGRVAAVNKAQQDAVLARKAVDAEVQRLQPLVEKIANVADMAEAQHNRVIPELGMTWEEVDWPAWFQQDRAQAALFHAQYEAEQRELQRVQSAKHDAEAEARRQFLQAEMLRLPELVPDLVGENGPKQKAALSSYLAERGYTQDELARFGAKDLAVAYDAMRFRQAQANAQALKATPQKPLPSSRPMRPAAAGGSTQTTRLQELEARAARTGSMDDVLALRRARRKG